MRAWLKVQQVAKKQIFFLHRLSVELIKRLYTIVLVDASSEGNAVAPGHTSPLIYLLTIQKQPIKA